MVLAAALPPFIAGAGGIIVLRARAEALLALVVAAEPKLYEGRDEEEEAVVVLVSAHNPIKMLSKTYAPMMDTAKATLFKRQAKP